MAQWYDGRPTEKPQTRKFLYLQCDCDDFGYRRDGVMAPEDFMVRLDKSRHVMVARHTDLLIPPEMFEDRDEKYCVWRNELGHLEFLTMTRDKTNRSHIVMATIEGGLETEWVCKHCISVARWIYRRVWKAKHLIVHWDDPYFEKLITRKICLEPSQETKKMWLDRHVCVTGWDFTGDHESRLFKQKGAGNEG